MFQNACGRLKLPPDLFWQLTFREFTLIAEGHAEEKRARQKDGAVLAWMAGYVQASAWSKDGMVDLKTVMGLLQTEEEKKLAEEEEQRELGDKFLAWAAYHNATLTGTDGGSKQ
jgi:hypothetical protein